MIDDDKPGHEHDGPSYPADAQRRQSYANAEQQRAQFPAPAFYRADNPHNRLYIAGLDGTGNDESKPQFGPRTNVAKIKDQINELHTNISMPDIPPVLARKMVGWRARGMTSPAPPTMSVSKMPTSS